MNEILNHIALLICLFGLIGYLLSTESIPARVAEVFKIMFWGGLLAVLLGK